MSEPVINRSSTLWLLNAATAAALIMFVTWGLVTPTPLRALRGTPFFWLSHLHNMAMHLCAYLLVTVTMLPLVSRHRAAIQRLVVGCIAGHAVVTELLQALIPQRTCDPLDFVANLLGIVAGVHLVPQLSEITAAVSSLAAERRVAAKAGHSNA